MDSRTRTVCGASRQFSRAAHCVLCAATLLSLAAAPRAGGQSGSATDQQQGPSLAGLSLEQLGEIKVTTADKEPEEVRLTPAAIYVLTQDDIRRSGATSIPEVLRLVPGVEVARVDSDHWVIGIRGFESAFSKSLLVMIDGRSVYTPLFEGVYWDVQTVPLDQVERIEVIRGPGGTVWGANAVDGVINIITKNAKDTHGVLASAGGGNVDQGTGEVRYGGSAGKDLDYRVYGTGFARGDEFHLDGNHFDGWRMGQAGFRADWNRDGKDAVTFQGDIYSGMEGADTGFGFFAPPSQMNVDNTALVSGGNLLARWQRKLNNGSDFQVQAYFDRTNRQSLQFGETRDTFDLDFVHHLPLPKRQDLIWGLGMRISPSDFIQTQPTVSFAPARQTDSIYSGFVQDQIGIVANKLFLTLGTKLEHNNFSGFDYQPTARLLWAATPRQSWWAAVTRAVRTPSRLDQDLGLIGFANEYAAGYPIFLKIAGDPGYAPEVMIGYEAGYRALIAPRLRLEVTPFFNNYDGLTSYGAASLGFAQSPPPSPYTYILITIPWANGLIGNTDGIEIDPEWRVTNWWQLKGSYSYLQMHLRDKAGITDTGTPASDVGSSPHHEIVIQSQFNLPQNLEFDPTYRYVSALPAQTVKSYSTIDVHLGWHLLGQRLEVSLVGQNLFQPQHAEFGGNPGPLVQIKRSIYAQLTWTMPEQTKP